MEEDAAKAAHLRNWERSGNQPYGIISDVAWPPAVYFTGGNLELATTVKRSSFGGKRNLATIVKRARTLAVVPPISASITASERNSFLQACKMLFTPRNIAIPPNQETTRYQRLSAYLRRFPVSCASSTIKELL